jgi:hypothetical protein
MRRRTSTVLLLALALFGGATSPYVSVALFFPCIAASDCAAMADLCDMAGMSSHDACCHPSLAGDGSALPATIKSPVLARSVQALQGTLATAQEPPAPACLFTYGSVAAASPPGGPPLITPLRI